jgi:hypothetical protein
VYFNITPNNNQQKNNKKSTFFGQLLPSEMLAADSQMTTGFFTFQSCILDAQFRGSCLVAH